MKHSFTYRIFASFMAFTMLISSTGVAMDIHYCQNTMEDISLFGEARTCSEGADKIEKSCKSKKTERSCKSSDSEKETKHQCQDDCCSKDLVYAQLETDFINTQEITTSLPDAMTTTLPQAIVSGNPQGAVSIVRHYLNYKPPIPDDDIPVLIQSFLI